MNEYEKSFADGERAAYRDRQAGALRQQPDEPLSPYGRAWWDGYTPRTSAWAVRTVRQPAATVQKYA